MTSFNNGDNEARDIDLTFRCHVNNIVPDSIFYDSMVQCWCLLSVYNFITYNFAIFCFCYCFLFEVVKTIDFIVTPMGAGKP